MVFDPILAVIAVILLIIAVGFGGTMLTDRAHKRDTAKIEAARREERAHQERLEQERMERFEETRKEESEAMEGARKRMAFAQEGIHQVQQEFQACHDELIADIHLKAKMGCDALFQQRFGITRPPKAADPQDDPEVQDFLREHYAELRDSALADSIDKLMRAEALRRMEAQSEAESASEEPEELPDSESAPESEEQASETAQVAESEATEAQDAEQEATVDEVANESADEPADGQDDAAEAAGDESDEKADENVGESPDEASDADNADENPEAEDIPDELLEAVREEFDIESIRTYLLAAISARYGEDARPIADLPWPAFTSLSNRGYGELVLAEGSPVYAQDAYRDFAWKKFHTGKRAEKPQRGEYSWPASHELGDGTAVESVPTPAGIFSVEGPKGAVTLYELLDCAWMRHSLEYQGALLEPDGQRSFFINLEGLRKGDELHLQFDGQDFLEEAEDGPYFLNAMGEVNGAFVGISASKPEAANVGEAPYELAERTPTGFLFRMTHDARRHDIDTYPQFLEVHVAWCQPPAPRPERIVRHVTN